jgi:hypothetical protein
MCADKEQVPGVKYSFMRFSSGIKYNARLRPRNLGEP